MKSKFTLMVVILLATLQTVGVFDPGSNPRSNSPAGGRHVVDSCKPVPEELGGRYRTSVGHVRARSNGDGMLRPSSPQGSRKHRSLEIVPKQDNPL